jgi:hypothetical protein
VKATNMVATTTKKIMKNKTALRVHPAATARPSAKALRVTLTVPDKTAKVALAARADRWWLHCSPRWM